MKLSSIIFLLGMVAMPICTSAQTITNYVGDETFMYAETKQVNQFFRRFNGEEDLMGKKLSKTDPNYQNAEFRSKYLELLFDAENRLTEPKDKDEFVEQVTIFDPQYIDFFGKNWFAEVTAKFKYNGTVKTVVLFLKLEKEKLGYKWVISNVYFEPFTKIFYADSTAKLRFMHPMSHELDFMNLVKVFQDPKNVEYYFEHNYKPDFTTLFIYETKRQNLVFQSIEKVNFHFFQIKDWYFELSEFNRNTANSGWLISNLTRIPEDQKDILLKYIYYEE